MFQNGAFYVIQLWIIHLFNLQWHWRTVPRQ